MRNFFVICTLPNIIRIIKSRRIKWVRHVAYGENGFPEFGTENLKGLAVVRFGYR